MNHGRSDVSHLLHESVLQGQMVSAVDEKLILQVLRRVKIFAGRLVTVATTLKRKQNDEMRYRALHGFGQAKIAYGNSILGLSQFTLLPQLSSKMMLGLKVVKIDSKISNSLHYSKSVSHCK